MFLRTPRLATRCAFLVGAYLFACQGEPVAPIRLVPQIAPVTPRRLDLAREGQRLLVQEDGGLVSLWDLSSSGAPRLLASMAAFATDVRFAPNGEGVITAGWDGRVRGWTNEGRLSWVSSERHNGRIRCLAVAAEVIATGGEDGNIRLWRPDGAAVGAPLPAHEIAVMSLAITPRGDIVSMGGDESIRLWRLTQTEPPRFRGSVLYQDPERNFRSALPNMLDRDPLWGWDRAAAVSPNGEVIAAVVLDGVVRLWNVDGSLRANLVGHGKRHVRAIAFSPRGDLLATAGWDGRVQLWNLDGSRHGKGIDAHDGPVFGLAFSPPGDYVVTSGTDNRVRIWNLDGTVRSDFPRGYAERILSVAVAPEEPVVAVAYRSGAQQGAVRLWSLTGAPRMSVRPVHDFPVESLAFSPRGDLFVTGDRRGTVQLWKLDGSAGAEPWHGHTREVTAVAVSPGGDMVASGARHEPLLVWDLDGHRRKLDTGVGDSISLIAFSPRGGLIAAAGVPGNVQIWDTAGWVRTPPFKVHQEFMHSLAFAPSGTYLATTGGGSSAIKLWSIDGTPHGAPLEGATGIVRGLAFATEDLLVSGGSDGVVRLWNIPARSVESLDIGLVVDQLGFWRDLLWVRTNTTLLFFDRARQLVATGHLRRDGLLVFTPDAWFTRTGNSAAGVQAFREKDGPLSVADTLQRLDVSKVLAALSAAAK